MALLAPAILFASSYGILRLLGRPLPEPHLSWSSIPVLFLVFSVGAFAEELGWTAYAVAPMQKRHSAFATGLVVGLVWTVWHTVPYFQMHRSPAWILWHGLFSVAARVLMVWLYNSAGRSVIVAILFHAMINVSISLFPENGSHYDPISSALLTVFAAAVVTFLWGPKTLSRFRYS